LDQVTRDVLRQCSFLACPPRALRSRQVQSNREALSCLLQFLTTCMRSVYRTRRMANPFFHLGPIKEQMLPRLNTGIGFEHLRRIFSRTQPTSVRRRAATSSMDKNVLGTEAFGMRLFLENSFTCLPPGALRPRNHRAPSLWHRHSHGRVALAK